MILFLILLVLATKSDLITGYSEIKSEPNYLSLSQIDWKIKIRSNNTNTALTENYRKCSSCDWIHPNHLTASRTPRSAVHFLHMRKCGGSSFLRIFKLWMMSKNCSDFSKYDTSGILGVFEGVMVRDIGGNVNISTSCPLVEMRHNEFKCLSKSLMNLLPIKENRNTLPLTFLTFLW